MIVEWSWMSLKIHFVKHVGSDMCTWIKHYARARNGCPSVYTEENIRSLADQYYVNNNWSGNNKKEI